MSYQALLFCPEEKTARVVTQVLTELDFKVELCNEPFAAVKKLMAQHFDAVVVDCDNEQNAMLLFKSARNSGTSAASLSVAVVEGQSGVAKAFRIGANLVLTKPINVEQSKGTLRVARGLLRKAEVSKPAAESAPSTSASATFKKPVLQSPASTVGTPATPPSFTPAPPEPPAPVAANSAFELDQEPGPKPEPTEAALLESMSDPSETLHTAEGSSQPKEFPWQPASRTAEPMASALRRAAAAAGQGNAPISFSTPAADATIKTADIRPFPTGPAMEAKSGVAKPKEELAIGTTEIKFSNTAVPEFEKPAHTAPPVEPPKFAALAVKDHEDEEQSEQETKSRSPFIVVVVVLGLLAAGYYAYTRLYPVAPHTSAPKATAPVQTAPVTPAPAATPAPSGEKPSASTPVPDAQGGQDSQVPFSDVETTPTHAAAAKSTSAPPQPGQTTPAAPKTAEPAPLVIKNDFSRPATIKTTDLDTAPPQISPAVQTDAGANAAISGIVTTKSVSMPKAAPLAVHVSQGVSQGLLYKRVQPIYPEAARQMRVQGAVELQANITKDGDISSVKVVHGDQTLAKAAVTAVKQWKYKPYYLNGEPIEIQTQITVNFKLPQ